MAQAEKTVQIQRELVCAEVGRSHCGVEANALMDESVYARTIFV